MDPDSALRKKTLETLAHKATLKQTVSDNTFLTFELLKEALHEIANEIDEELEEKIDKRIRIEYRDRGKYEAQIQVAEDLLLFQMHTDVFRFHESHQVWKVSYVEGNPDNAYCGVINIYNFLADSFKFNRGADEGYLIGRIFVNRNGDYFVEGKIDRKVGVSHFGTDRLDAGHMRNILEHAIHYSLVFDLYVPPYEKAMIVTVEQFNTKTENPKLEIGKLLGFKYDCENI